MFNPPHPGRLILDFMQDRSVTEVARHLGITRAMLSRVVHGKASVSAELALRLAEGLGLEAEVWLTMQVKRDLWVASKKKRVKVERLVVIEEAA